MLLTTEHRELLATGALSLAAFLVVLLALWRASAVVLRFERAFFRLARRRVACVGLVFALALGARMAASPLVRMGAPRVHDELSYLLAADTFASGRATNPAPAIWQPFETMHVLLQPTYMSMYPPAQGLALAAGRLLSGSFAFGVWLGVAALCAAVCWMLQGWLPPGWALLGGVLCVVRFAICGYWATSYWGGAVAGAGGALALGALPRMTRRMRARDAIVLGVGLLVLANSRPYEGFVLALVVAGALAWWLARLRGARLAGALARVVLPLGATLAIGGAAMAWYFWRVTGSPVTMPYVLDARTYGMASLFVFGDAPPLVEHHHAVMADYYGWMAENLAAVKPLRALVVSRVLSAAFVFFPFYAGFAFTASLALLPRVVRDGRVRLLVVALVAGALALSIEVWPLRHYFAPFTAAALGVLVQGMRHVRLAGRRSPWRLALTWSVPFACAIGLSSTLAMPDWQLEATPHGLVVGRRSGFGEARLELIHRLEEEPGDHLVIVRYAPRHNRNREWVYNGADLERARVVFAREMQPQWMRALLAHYPDRHAWLLEPDATPVRLVPYRPPSEP